MSGGNEIPGWLDDLDEAVMRFFLGEQIRAGQRGDIAELGVFLGKSAVVLGDYVQVDESFTVIDLFDTPSADAANSREIKREYANLTRSDFEKNYLSRHASLPVIIQGLSHTIVDHAAHGSHRLVHIDASHQYANVVLDIAATKLLLAPTGIVVFDDIREAHTPGVAAAVWGAIATDGLRPLAISEHKMYATWGPTASWQERLTRLSVPGEHEVQQVAGFDLYRCHHSLPLPPTRWRRAATLSTPPALLHRIDRLRSR